MADWPACPAVALAHPLTRALSCLRATVHLSVTLIFLWTSDLHDAWHSQHRRQIESDGKETIEHHEHQTMYQRSGRHSSSVPLIQERMDRFQGLCVVSTTFLYDLTESISGSDNEEYARRTLEQSRFGTGRINSRFYLTSIPIAATPKALRRIRLKQARRGQRSEACFRSERPTCRQFLGELSEIDRSCSIHEHFLSSGAVEIREMKFSENSAR